MAKNPQLMFIKKYKMSYGGDLRRTRAGRAHGRPLDTRYTMHLVLRSSKAKGKWSFFNKNNPYKIKSILEKFGKKFGVQVLSIANVGNHLHLQIKLSNRFTWRAFIRAVTAAIAMAITGTSRWNKVEGASEFWDHRPFTRVVVGRRAFLSLKDYIEINKWEGWGANRAEARTIVAANKAGSAYWNTA
jgi:REP element-mobilizing transposase RayT